MEVVSNGETPSRPKRQRTRSPRTETPQPPIIDSSDESTGGALRYADAQTALAEIGKRFKEARQQSKAQAWRRLLDDISINLDLLAWPDAEGIAVISLKDAIAMLRECEEFVKGNEQAEVSPLEALQAFLNGN